MKLNDFLNNVFGTQRSENEFNQLQEWKNAGELNAKALKEMAELHNTSSALGEYKSFDVESALANTMAKVDQPNPSSVNRTIFILAGALILASLLGYFIYKKYTDNTVNQIIASDKQELYEKEDGSQFLINSGSELTINDKENSYELDGEAFFDVVKQVKPIIIHTYHGDITVLGTSFNVVTNEAFTEVFMFDGTISYRNNTNDSAMKVTKGQCIVANSEGNKIMEDLSDQAFSYWRTKTLKYSNTPLSVVIDDLNKIFQQDIVIKDSYKSIIINTSFVNNSYNQIIDELQVITGLTL